MSIWKAGAIAGIAVFAAAACSKTGDGDAADKAAPAAVEVPKRKPGLWKQTMLVEGADAVHGARGVDEQAVARRPDIQVLANRLVCACFLRLQLEHRLLLVGWMVEHQ